MLTGYATNIPLTKNDSLRQKFNYNTNGRQFQFTFLEFGAKGCSACRQMEPVMADIKKDEGTRIIVIFYNLTTDEGLAYSKIFGVIIIPTQVILDRNGNEIFRHTGVIDKNTLLKTMN